MEIYFYQAECGDAARIRYKGSDSQFHNIFIDSGFQLTYHHVLKDEIKDILRLQEKIDLWIVTHIHADHIGGILEYIKEIRYEVITDAVQAWYYNLPRLETQVQEMPKFSISNAKSIKQGDILATYLFNENKLAECDVTTNSAVRELFGLKLTILSPTPLNLEALREKYNKTEKPLEAQESISFSEAKRSKENDYDIPLQSFNLDNWEEDNSIENGSSIAFTIQFMGKTILWLSDSHPTTITKSLKELGYSVDNPLVCDWVKVAHHGSKGNNSNELYQLIRCQNYLMSVNGENRDNLPTKECIARILRNSNRPSQLEYNFYFTYDNQTLRNIFLLDGKDVFEGLNFKANYQNLKTLKIILND